MKTKLKAPKKSCEDDKCFFHGKISVRGRTFVGTVISAKMQKTAIVEFLRKIKIPKYERYSEKRSRIKAHNPDCLKASEGDIVKIMECRPLSKTVNFVVVQNIGVEKGYTQRMESLEESKKPEKEKKEEESQTNIVEKESAPEVKNASN